MFLAVAVVCGLVAPAYAQGVGFGVLGDSNSDEYRADDDRGGSFASVTFNWVELLEGLRGVNFGSWGTRAEPRRTGFAYNWARTGARTDSLISGGQKDGIVGQVQSGAVDYAIVNVGLNDFNLFDGTYEEIYDGTLSDAEVEAKVNGIVADLTTIVDDVLDAGASGVVVVNFADVGLAPGIDSVYPNPAGRARVTAAIEEVNAGIDALVASRNIALGDQVAFSLGFLGAINSNGDLIVGGVPIALVPNDNNPTHLRLGDPLGHPGTVLSGLMANALVVEPLNERYGLGLTPLRESEVLAAAGLEGTDPEPTPSPTPTPSPIPLPGVQSAARTWNLYK